MEESATRPSAAVVASAALSRFSQSSLGLLWVFVLSNLIMATSNNRMVRKLEQDVARQKLEEQIRQQIEKINDSTCPLAVSVVLFVSLALCLLVCC